MKSIRYLKVALTVIAVCLALICLRDVSLVGTASAWNDTTPGRYQIASSDKGFVVRVDSLTGQVCTYTASQDERGSLTGCTPSGN